jgi:hypothetical protein
MTEKRPIGDMKAGLTSSRPKLSILPRAALLHMTRALEYGADYYARGNYHGPAPIDPKTGERIPEEIAILGYLDAELRHVYKVTDAVNKALGTGGDARAAIATVDDVAIGKPPSMLPDLGHAMASLAIAIERAVAAGILPEDPGQPWRAGRVTEERSPEASARLATPAKAAPATVAAADDGSAYCAACRTRSSCAEYGCRKTRGL